MKRIKVFLLTAMLMLGLTACGDDKDNKDKKEDKEVVETVVDDKDDKKDTTEVTTEEAKEEMETKSGVYFLFNSTDWGEEKDLTGLNLYGDKLTLPITLEQIDANCGPFVYGHRLVYEPFYRVNATSLNELHDLDYVFDASSDVIQIQSQVSWNEETNWTDYKDEWDCNFSWMYLEDLKDTGMTVAEAWDSGRWYLESGDKGEYAFGTSDENVKGMKSEEIYAYIAENFGKPSYIYFGDQDFAEKSNILLTNDNGVVIYYLVYEREEYAVVISVFEMINDGKNYSPTFNQVWYYTATQWADYKEVNGINDSNIIPVE